MATHKNRVSEYTAFALGTAALLAATGTARAQLGYDPFADNSSHTEEQWTAYTVATTGGINRPGSVFVNGVSTPAAASFFNVGVVAPNPSNGFITGGHIYSFANALTLAASSTYAPAAGEFNTVVFSIQTSGNLLNTNGVTLTTGTGSTLSSIFTSASSVPISGGFGGYTSQYAFQFDLSTLGGSNNFSIALPGADSSVSFANSQLDATTTVYGTQNAVVPEPDSVALLGVAAAIGGLWGWTRRFRSGVAAA